MFNIIIFFVPFIIVGSLIGLDISEDKVLFIDTYNVCIEMNDRYHIIYDAIKSPIDDEIILNGLSIDGDNYLIDYWYELEYSDNKNGKYYVSWSDALEQNTNLKIKVATENCHINIHVTDDSKPKTDIDIIGEIFTNSTTSVLGTEYSNNTIPLLFHSDIIIWEFSTQDDYQLQSVIRHEIGHVLGLPHTEKTFMSEAYDSRWTYIPEYMVKQYLGTNNWY